MGKNTTGGSDKGKENKSQRKETGEKEKMRYMRWVTQKMVD